ncbi:MAG: sigma-54-dependent Fis family transcriptional regulator [Lentisphaerae bacterium]|nr:sigma-54-dependent Fis family transcriptional regulator [Lentisphaerota bacterium]
MKRILVVDDEIGTRESLRAVFARKYEVRLAENAAAGMQILGATSVDVLLLDVLMPEKDGLAFLRDLRGTHPDLPVVMISAGTSVRPVVEAMRDGAFDYVTKPFDVLEIERIVERAIESTTLHRRVQTLEFEIEREFPVSGIVGGSESFLKALADARKAAESDATVLVTGESGTGKELVARLIHAASPRRDEPFVAVHCAALPETLMESELFGHEKGAFTSADRMKPGRFDLAGAGTLFFDEVSEMTPVTQVKLLRVLQEHEFMRVGGTRVIRTEARIVAATAKDLKQQAARGEFRDDLYYRIGVVPIRLPPLRAREGDVPLLARHFLRQCRPGPDTRARDFAPEAMELLCAYRWPGNVRELRNVVERMLVLHGNEPLIRAEHLPEEFQGARAGGPEPPEGGTLEELVGAFEKRLIEKALADSGGVQTRAAEQLGTTRRILRYRMDKLGIAASNGGGD